MMGTQYTYFTAIEYSNAAIATVLTYFGPTLVLVYVYMREARRPLKYEIFSIVLSMFGVFLLATHGNCSGLQISFKALPDIIKRIFENKNLKILFFYYC